MDAKWQGTVEIDAPVERVYEYLADFPKHCEWAQTLDRMELKQPGQQNGVGSVYLTYEMQAMQADRAPKGALPEKGFKGKTECTVTELVPNKRIAWKAHPVPVSMGVHASLAFDLQPDPKGGTIVKQTIEMHQPWLPMQVFSRAAFKMKPAEMEARGAAQWQASLDNIKQVLEQPAGQ
jgi:uncharacterized protein YndB with AHSA1/START domain